MEKNGQQCTYKITHISAVINFRLLPYLNQSLDSADLQNTMYQICYSRANIRVILKVHVYTLISLISHVLINIYYK